MTLPALVIFDMAGTTVEDRGQVPSAFAATLAANNILITADEITRVRGVRWNVGVLSGAHSREALSTAPHTHIIQSVADLGVIVGVQ